MSLFSYKPANQLPDDVLLVIFDQLEDQDLLRCETVCHQWRNVLLSGRLWKGLFHRKIVSSPLWRHVFLAIGMNLKKLETVNYRVLCKAIIQELHEIDNNWRTGSFKITKQEWYSNNFPRVVIGKDWIAILDINIYKYINIIYIYKYKKLHNKRSNGSVVSNRRTRKIESLARVGSLESYSVEESTVYSWSTVLDF
jgi:F-box-like